MISFAVGIWNFLFSSESQTKRDFVIVKHVVNYSRQCRRCFRTKPLITFITSVHGFRLVSCLRVITKIKESY